MTPAEQTLLSTLREHRVVPVVLLTIALLALVNWILSPEQALRWLRVMLMLPALSLALGLWHWFGLRSIRRRGVEDLSATMRYFASALAMVILGVGLWQIVMLGLEIWVEMSGRVDLDVERRILGLTSSAVLVVVGNALPKILTPLSMLSPERAALVTTARRFVGTTLVVLGLVTGLAFVSAPLAFAKTLMQWAMVAVLLTTLGAIVWMNLSASRPPG